MGEYTARCKMMVVYALEGFEGLMEQVYDVPDSAIAILMTDHQRTICIRHAVRNARPFHDRNRCPSLPSIKTVIEANWLGKWPANVLCHPTCTLGWSTPTVFFTKLPTLSPAIFAASGTRKLAILAVAKWMPG